MNKLKVIWYVLRGRPVCYRFGFVRPIQVKDVTNALIMECRVSTE